MWPAPLEGASKNEPTVSPRDAGAVQKLVIFREFHARMNDFSSFQCYEVKSWGQGQAVLLGDGTQQLSGELTNDTKGASSTDKNGYLPRRVPLDANEC